MGIQAFEARQLDHRVSQPGETVASQFLHCHAADELRDDKEFRDHIASLLNDLRKPSIDELFTVVPKM